ncbi:MAG: Holliday junction DNA helicase RuvA [Treponema sp. GWB1_62_6]|nr:MAG: Holliday junction DNA helicase RuvA [Treponema sp. GWA1_62_8]OHE67439.1 MAG: Holliday junction DNA helicase RuvA [Treponema sp. GWC1_61_84]OHE72518.1 MAG: Holliday junction DNA helicase RuvA [Treponema sp. GWB1_62_6]OHE76767.1 MAG: Holliday junction DNA helicase RuvA [Treponema sp. RIFOXYC1_FULL_61_9]HCM28381.1 Holliday junction branch migration protein RuvA [Treponema sp.]
MFNSIRGLVTEKRQDAICVETGGIEWDIAVPATDLKSFPPVGGTARVFIWLYHREDQMRLYGFLDDRRRDTFLELQKVEGIGPKAAAKIMGGISQAELERALDSGDVERLEAVPGLGKKTAQKMVLTLKGKLAVTATRPASVAPHAELVDALVGMGYDRKSSSEIIARCVRELETELAALEKAEAEKLLFKRAIVLLSGA